MVSAGRTASPTPSLGKENAVIRRKITRTEATFRDKDAVTKLLHLGLRTISSQRRGFSGTGTYNWTVALNTPTGPFPDDVRCVRTQFVVKPRRALHSGA